MIGMQHINLSALHAHPKNPRLAPRDDVVEQLAAQMGNGLDEAHALIVRPQGDAFEIISGHHRRLAAVKAGLTSVPCWVREMSDESAYMALALNNAQGELSPLEIGLHALGSGLNGSEYARQVGVPQTTMAHRISAAKVLSDVNPHGLTTEISDRWRHLAELHAAPRWLWSALVSALIANDLTVEQVRKAAQRLKDVDHPSNSLFDTEAIAISVVSGDLSPSDTRQFTRIFEDCISSFKEDSERFLGLLIAQFKQARPSSIFETKKLCHAISEEHRALVAIRQQEDLLRTKRDEEVRARTARLIRNVSLEEWKALADDERAALLNLQTADNVNFNKQENDAIEWAQWSWNPVTGCQHNCPYCYARDIATSTRMAKAYPNGFEPTFRPSMLLAPRYMKVPPAAAKDTRYRNVFTCSMADLFGRWVPAEWIEAVLGEIRKAPQWNFLCLTKFPKRMAEFDIPSNAWMGTSVDLQARVANAESAFENVKAGVRWLSVEPMLEPLKFKHLDRFNWIVIGGASASSQTPEWFPPYEWIHDLVNQARAANVKIYMKTNLGIKKRLIELPFDAPIPSENSGPPQAFSYLGKEKTAA